MTALATVPHSDSAEWSVIGQMLSQPMKVSEVIGGQLELEDFFRPDCRLIFELIVHSFYADEPIDPVVIGDRLAKPLSSQWSVSEPEVSERLYQQAQARKHEDSISDHIRLLKRHGTNRRLLALCEGVKQRIDMGEPPEEIGDFLTTEASRVTTGSEKRSEIIAHVDVGREYIKYLQRLKAAQEQGIELAVYTGRKFFDNWVKGLNPGELAMVAGPPGVGKSAAVWDLMQGFAIRQVSKAPEKRVGCLALSMEMTLPGSSSRVATSITGLDGDKFREGNVTNDELSLLIKRWKDQRDLPLYWNFASNFKMSQMRALVVEAIRRHNVGLIVVDHFRMFDPDRRINNANQEDEAKARFLKEDIAKDLNVAVICLAHTIKLRREDGDGRPTLADLRGSGQTAAHCDVVGFMHMPWMFATQGEKDEGVVDENDAEMIYRKNRSGKLGTAPFTFRPDVMSISDK